MKGTYITFLQSKPSQNKFNVEAYSINNKSHPALVKKTPANLHANHLTVCFQGDCMFLRSIHQQTVECNYNTY